MAFIDTIFINRHRPKSSTYVDDTSDSIEVVIKSDRYLSEEQLDLICSVVKSDIARRIKPQDIAIDVIAYSGIYATVSIVKTDKHIEVTIG